MIPHSALSEQIRSLRADAHRPVIHFFEKHESAIRGLEPWEYLDILLIYLDALFACGEYARFLGRVDEGLILALDSRLQTLAQGEVYHHLLYRKAAATWHGGDLKATEHILRQLLRLDPGHALAARFLTRCLSTVRKTERQRVRALSIGFFLLTTLVLVLEALWIRPFRAEWTGIVEITRNVLFVLGWIALGGGEWLLHRSALRETLRWRQQKAPAASRLSEKVTGWP
jgi:hypothetical protein